MATFEASLIGADGRPGQPLQVQPVERSGQVVLEVNSSGTLGSAGLFIRVAYNADKYSPVAAQATGAYAPLASSLTMETMQDRGIVEFGQVPLAGTAGQPAAGTPVLEVMFAPHPYTAPRQVRGVPSSSAAVSPLLWDAANQQLKWYYVNPGDYDQNSTVGITDLQPLGAHFRQAGPFAFQTALSVIDGVPDGEINISDLSPIGVNFGNKIENYNLYFSTNIADTPQDFSGASTIAPLASVPFSAAQGNPLADRRFFTFDVPPGQPAGFYWVRPESANQEGAASEGTRSNVNTGDPDSNPPPPDDPGPGFNVKPVADLHLTMQGTAVPLNVTLDASGSHDPDGTIISYEWDFEGDGLFDAWSTAPSVIHGYSQPGVYGPTVRVIDNSGGMDQITVSPFTATPQTISNINPTADIMATALAGPAPLTVGLLATGSHDVDGTIAKYEWDFDGDNTFDLDSGTDPTVLHTYSAAGNFNATVRITDNRGGQATDSIAVTAAAVVVNQLPTAALQASTLSGNAPLTVNFDGSASADPDGSLVEFAWDFDGDGAYDATSEAGTLSRVYAQPGVYPAKLRVKDNSGATASATATITVNVLGNVLPTADLQSNVQTGNAPLSVSFDATASVDSDGSLVRYDYDFDNDGVWDAYDAASTVGHAYALPGSYTAKVRVTDNSGAQATASLAINVTAVGNLSPTADLQSNVSSGNAPLSVNFDASASADSDGSLVRYDFDFDNDGAWDAYDADSTISHVYTAAGSYTAKVRVTDNSGAQATATKSITVNAVNNILPTAVLSSPTSSGNAPLTVSFSGASSSDPDGSIVRYDYDFNNDGIWDAYDSGTAVSHTYTVAGNYTAKLRVTDDKGGQANATKAITVNGSGGTGGPTAGLTATPQNFSTVPKDVVLDPSSSTAGAAPISRYDWDLNNDGFFDTYSGSPLTLTQHIVSVGVYQYKLRVTDTNGQYDEKSITVTASGPPLANLVVTPGNPVSPNITVTLDGSGSSDPGGSITKYEFDKDGNGSYETDNGTNPITTTTFAVAGDYTVHLRVTDNDGNQDTKAFTVQVRVAIITIADNAGNPGRDCAVAIVNGNPAIAYHRNTGSDVVYCRATSTDGSTWGSPIVVANLSGGGFYIDLVVANGNPALIYTDANSHLLYLRADDANGSAWTAGNAVTINNGVSYGASMAIIGGNPAIAYGDQATNAMYYKRATDASGTAFGAAGTINSGGSNGGDDSSLVEVNGLPAVTYFFWNGSAGVRYKRASDLAGSSWPTSVDISTNGTVNLSALDPSLYIVNGNPAVCYYDRNGTALRYRRGSDANGSAFGSEVTVVSGGDDGDESQLGFNNNLPYIAYHDANADTLRLIIGADANGSSWGASQLIDSGPNGAGGDIDMVPISTHMGIVCDATGAAVGEVHFDYVP